MCVSRYSQDKGRRVTITGAALAIALMAAGAGLAQPRCPTGGMTIFGQEPDIDTWTLLFSDADQPQWNREVRYEEFDNCDNRIARIHFWGLEFGLTAAAPRLWTECLEDPTEFDITFHYDNNGRPGAAACEYSLAIAGVPVANVGYHLFTVYEYTADLDPPCAIRDGWISIAGTGPLDNCWFAWMSSTDGDHKSLADVWAYEPTVWPYDLAFCLITDGEPAFGACCDDASGTCREDIALADCAGRFVAGTCADFDPPCGEAVGACCSDNGHCYIATKAACDHPTYCRGDLNCDGLVDFGDINPFVLLLSSPLAYEHRYPDCHARNGDCNGDGDVNLGDINPFINLFGSDCGRTWLGPHSDCGQCALSTIVIPDDLPLAEGNSTCGFGNQHDETCLGPYDGGEDVVYELIVVGDPIDVEISLDPAEAASSAMLLDDEYPPAGGCLLMSASHEPVIHGFGCRRLEPGTYYLMIDTWPAPDCIEQFELYIVACDPPLGRCCYDDPPRCADETEDDCARLDGVWDGDLDCTTPCPGKEDEDCLHARVIESLPYSTQFDTSGMTADGPPAPCDRFGPAGQMRNDAWFVWTADADGLVTATAGGDYDMVLVAADGCENPSVLACADLSEAGANEVIQLAVATGSTYYFQVGHVGNHGGGGLMTLDLDIASGSGACCFRDGDCQVLAAVECFNQGGTYQGDGTDCDPNNCPPASPGDNCDEPIEVVLNSAALPFVDSNWTTGRGNDYTDTCLGSFDSGEDIVYKLTVAETVVVDITLDPKGTEYAGFLLSETCSPADQCYAWRHSIEGGPNTLEYAVLRPGDHYLIIDKWLAPTGIPDFDLTIEWADFAGGACCLDQECVINVTLAECLDLGGTWYRHNWCPPSCEVQQGNTCEDPIVVQVPPDPPWLPDVDTCSPHWGTTYAGDSCLGIYDGGREVIYKLVVTGEPACVQIDVRAYTYPGRAQGRFAISEVCPPAGDCSIGKGLLRDVWLTPGEHYLMVDRHPSRCPQYSDCDCATYSVEIRPCN